ncbi:MAG: diphthine--ammonia ligase [Chitinophagaceae bacterium]|nr:diphthine--ammonia ligase [Chitinophagaceae bacterium]
MEKKSLCSWSGGKDSCFALMNAMNEGFRPVVLLNVLNENGVISRSHGIPATILERQAAAVGIPIRMVSSSWTDYEAKFKAELLSLKVEFQITHAIFGDIDLQAHRDWEEKVCEYAGIEAVLPLWQKNRKDLVMKMIASGMEMMIVSCNETMGSSFIGEMVTPGLVARLEALGVDPCGENGEYHTLVVNGPLFSSKLVIEKGGPLLHNNYWFLQWEQA